MNFPFAYSRLIADVCSWLVHVSLFSFILCSINDGSYIDSSHVEVRAVFIDCELVERKDESIENDNTRFQREELFKHNVLRNCKKKLAMTVKMTSEPGKISCDEYIPVDHVFDGSKKKRLLNPFVLRLRRDRPLQAYKIRRIDTVNGILINTEDDNMFRTKEKTDQNLHTFLRPKRTVEHNKSHFPACSKTEVYENNTSSYSLDILGNNKSYVKKRIKRQSGILSEDNYFIPWNNKDYHPNEQDREVRDIFQNYQRPDNYNKEPIAYHYDASNLGSNFLGRYNNHNKNYNVQLFNPYNDKTPETHRMVPNIEDKQFISNSLKKKRNEKYYAVYNIGNPDLWYTVNLQLYEKLSTPEGKTVWNDITRDETASVNTLHPEWSNEDVSIKYRPVDKNPEEFFLTKSSLCLLVPILTTGNSVMNNDADIVIDKHGEFFVVAADDIIPKHNYTQKDNALPVANVTANELPRSVLVRKSRAVMGGRTDSLVLASSGLDQYLMIPHQHPYQSQIDLESRADDNQLVHVGSSGRIIIAVSDNTRIKHTAITLEVSNTGLVASNFRVAVRDCFTQSLGRTNSKEAQKLNAGPALLPPKHTHRFLLEIPFEVSSDIVHCTATLINSDDVSVAVRDVAIKRNDRCFCVWHCQCVCLSVDPKLLCKEMSETLLLAAGLSASKVARRTRSVCYPDNVTLNIAVIVVGVLAALLALGFVKAILGLVFQCIASWGVERLLMLPRKLDHYHESSLRYRPVVYDDEGWPIHPDTMKRSVRYISKPVEFALNLIFFVTLPCVMLCETLQLLYSKCGKTQSSVKFKSKADMTTYNTEDIQVTDDGPERRCESVRKWSKSHADELSSVIWEKGLSIHKATTSYYMRSLLRDECCRKSDDISYSDSEQDDTEYVLMQMQKSRESLARSQRKLSEDISKIQCKDDAMPSTSKR